MFYSLWYFLNITDNKERLKTMPFRLSLFGFCIVKASLTFYYLDRNCIKVCELYNNFAMSELLMPLGKYPDIRYLKL